MTNFDYADGPPPSLVQVLRAEPPARNKPAVVGFEPGSKWQYSNIGYVAIQLLLEDLTGRPLNDLMREVVFEPLGMKSSTLTYPLEAGLREKEALPHDVDGKTGEPGLHATAQAQGGLMTTPSDLARFTIELMKAFQGESDLILNRDTARATLRPERDLDPPPRVAVVLAHPLPTGGGTMHSKVVYQIAKGFCRIGAPVLRFNFRGVGTSEGAFEDGPGEMADYRAALDFMAARYPGVELWAAGFSFGAWVALTVGAMDDRVSALIGVAPPVDRYDFSAVLESLKPTFFIQGDRDDLCPYPSMRAFYARVPGPKELVTIDGADHLFDGKTSEVAEAVEELV